MQGIVQFLFWASVLLLAYTYVGYPAVVFLWARLRPSPVARRRWEPGVTLVVVAHNEALRIEARLANLVSLDYPRHRLQILVASDGSTDGTEELARAWEGAGVEIVAFERRRGKPAVLNDLFQLARGEIVVQADARQRFAADVVRALVASFADPMVGAVSGELILTYDKGESAVGEGVGAYWRFEKLIRWSESQVDSAVGTTGAIYAIRRSLFEPIPEDTILDDVWLPMRIVRRGYRVLFEPGARAWDQAPATAAEELARKARTLAGNFQLFAREGWLLNPFWNRLWFQTCSHKGLRLLTPLLQVVALTANVLILDSAVYWLALVAQIAFYAAAVGGYAFRGASRSIPLLTVPYVVCLFGWATVVGFVRFVTGRQRVIWDKARPAGPQGEILRPLA